MCTVQSFAKTPSAAETSPRFRPSTQMRSCSATFDPVIPHLALSKRAVSVPGTVGAPVHVLRFGWGPRTAFGKSTSYLRRRAADGLLGRETLRFRQTRVKFSESR